MNNNNSVIKNIFKDFYELTFSKDNNSSSIKEFDLKISDYILYRQTKLYGSFIYFIYNGSYFHIPNKCLYLFLSLSNYSSNEILYCDEKCLDYSDKIIYLMVDLISTLNNSISTLDDDRITDILNEISVIGTKNFINWVSLNYNLYIPPIEFRSIEKRLDI